jgi:hypothetical protein
MDRTLDLESRGYIECEDDPGWYRCEYCRSKVYVGSGEKLVDLVRHEIDCEFREPETSTDVLVTQNQ